MPKVSEVSYEKVSSTPSIKDALNKKMPKVEKKEKVVEVSQNKELQNETFTEETLNKIWLSYVEEIKKTSLRMYSSLKDEKLSLLENNKVVLEFGNSSILEDFEHSFKNKAEYYLKANLKNDLLELCLKISVQSKTNTNILYTPQDKFRYLSEKNPLLEKFRQDFNLDYE